MTGPIESPKKVHSYQQSHSPEFLSLDDECQLPPLDIDSDFHDTNPFERLEGESECSSRRSSCNSSPIIFTGERNHYQLPGPLSCFDAFLSFIPRHHFNRTIALSIPAIIGALLNEGIILTNIALVGQISSEYLGAVSLAFAFMLTLGFGLIYGMNSALDTLCATAVGANENRIVGLLVQRSFVAYSIILLPIIISMWNYCGDLYLFVGENFTIAMLAGEFVHACIPCLFPFLYAEILKRYFASQAIVKPQIYIGLITFMFHAIVTWYLIYQQPQFGIRNGAYGLIATYALSFILWSLYAKFGYRTRFQQNFPTLRFKAVFQGWGSLFALGFAGVGLIFLEWIAFDIIQILGGLLPNPNGVSQVAQEGGSSNMNVVALDCMTIYTSLITLSWTLHQGVGYSATTLVGQAMGGGRFVQAQFFAKAATILISIVVTFESCLFFLFRASLTSLFTDDTTVQMAFMDVLPFMMFYISVDGMQVVQSGILRGVGLQQYCAITTFVAYYLLGLPIGVLLAFNFDWNIIGLCIGMILSAGVQSIVYTIKIWTIDWSEEAQIASDRIDAERPDSRSSQLTDEESDEEESLERAKNRKQFGFIN